MRKVRRKKKKSNLRNSGAINHHTRWYSSVNSVQSYQFKKIARECAIKMQACYLPVFITHLCGVPARTRELGVTCQHLWVLPEPT